ncbi:UNVERIFIED_CONTAM: hypothetical protein NCL1_40029 [Trichonephila clavipes]
MNVNKDHFSYEQCIKTFFSSSCINNHLLTKLLFVKPVRGNLIWNLICLYTPMKNITCVILVTRLFLLIVLKKKHLRKHTN